MADSQVPEDLLYTEEHEYVKRTDSTDEVFIGITDYAQSELSDIVFVELPQVGASLSQMESFGTVEAVKAVSELYTPISGEVLAVNTSLDEDPAVINRDPFGEGWMIKVKMKDSSELDSLLSADEYKALISES